MHRDTSIDYIFNDDKKGEAVIGFAGKNEVHGYFLPLEITDNSIDDQDEISAEFMGENVDADIIKSGDSYYAVVLLTNNHALKFGDTSLTITIELFSKLRSSMKSCMNMQNV